MNHSVYLLLYSNIPNQTLNDYGIIQRMLIIIRSLHRQWALTSDKFTRGFKGSTKTKVLFCVYTLADNVLLIPLQRSRSTKETSRTVIILQNTYKCRIIFEIRYFCGSTHSLFYVYFLTTYYTITRVLI